MAKSPIAVKLVFNRLPELKGQVRRRASQAVRKTAFDVEAGAKARSRVDTGNMKNGWQTEIEDDLNAWVYNDVEYVVHHEFGTHKMSAQPMAIPAAEEVRPSFNAAMKELLD